MTLKSRGGAEGDENAEVAGIFVRMPVFVSSPNIPNGTHFAPSGCCPRWIEAG
jgi:hypothetical protein